METTNLPNPNKRAFTLLEMTIVIMVLLTLIGIGFFTNNKLQEWKLGRTASETLRSVYTAQRMYLADNPTITLSTLSNADAAALILPYIPNAPAAMPTIETLEGGELPIAASSSPPFAGTGEADRYDPSGSFTDSLWDVGQ